MPDEKSQRFSISTFGLGVAALAGMISLVGLPAGLVEHTDPAGKNAQVIAQAIVAASLDPPINLLGFPGTGCSPTNGQCSQ
jgi:hypothetical protein